MIAICPYPKITASVNVSSTLFTAQGVADDRDSYEYERMKSAEEIKAENLEKLINELADGNASKLSRILGKDPTLISRWRPDNKNQKRISPATAREIEKKLQEIPGLPFQIGPYWMDQDHSSPSSDGGANPLAGNLEGDRYEAELVDLGPSLSPRMVPVVGMAQLGDNGFYEELGFPPGDGDGFIQAVTKDVNAYALKVRGNSMHPAIRDGWIVMVEPNSEPQVGEFAVIQCANGRKMVKEFLGWRGDELILQSVNEDHGRLTLLRSEVKAIHAVGGIHPPSKREIR